MNSYLRHLTVRWYVKAIPFATPRFSSPGGTTRYDFYIASCSTLILKLTVAG